MPPAKTRLVGSQRDALGLVSRVVIFDIAERMYYEIRRYLCSIGVFRGNEVSLFQCRVVGTVEELASIRFESGRDTTFSMELEPTELLNMVFARSGNGQVSKKEPHTSGVKT